MACHESVLFPPPLPPSPTPSPPPLPFHMDVCNSSCSSNEECNIHIASFENHTYINTLLSWSQHEMQITDVIPVFDEFFTFPNICGRMHVPFCKNGAWLDLRTSRVSSETNIVHDETVTRRCRSKDYLQA